MLEKSTNVTNCWLSESESLTIVHPDFSSGCVLDAQGNQMNIYEHEVSAENASYAIVERNIYGSSRIGTFIEKVNLLSENTSVTQDVVLGNKLYELTNHLGNVLTVIKDIKIPIQATTSDEDEEDEQEEIPNPYFNPDGTIALHNLSLINNTCNQIGLNFNDPPVSPANHEFIDIDNDGDVDMRVYSNAGPYASEFAFSARITFNSIPGETYNLEFTLNEMNYVSFLEVYPINCGDWINNGYLYANANGNYSMQTTAQGIVTEFKFLTYKQNQNINGQFVISNLKITGPGEIYPFETPTNETLCGNPDEVAYYEVAIASVADYSPFGVQLDERTLESERYRYGFQNQEKDDEVKGEGNSVNYKYRMHDPRLGRFFAVDPLAFFYTHNSPYAFSENIVINMVELEGLEATESESRSTNEVGYEESLSNPIVVSPIDYWGKTEIINYGNYWKDKVNYGHSLIKSDEYWLATVALGDGKSQLYIYNSETDEWLHAVEEGLKSFLEANNNGNYLHTPDELIIVEEAKKAQINGTATLDQLEAIAIFNDKLPVNWDYTAKWFHAYGFDEGTTKLILFFEVSLMIAGNETPTNARMARTTPKAAKIAQAANMKNSSLSNNNANQQKQNPWHEFRSANKGKYTKANYGSAKSARDARKNDYKKYKENLK